MTEPTQTMYTVILAAPFTTETPEAAVDRMLDLLARAGDRKQLVYIVQDPITGERWKVQPGKGVVG